MIGRKEANNLPKIASKIASSDFDDDSLDDLPSLSDILRGIGSGTAPADQAGPEAHQRGDSVYDSPLHGVEQTGTGNQPEELQALQILKDREIIEISDDSTPDPGKDIFTNPEGIGSSIATAPLSSSSGNVIRLLSRNSSSSCRAYEARIPERAERFQSPKYLLPPLNMRHTLSHLEPMSAINSVSKDPVHRTPTNSSSGWDDVDRLLLEEFKDVINHY